MCVHIPVADCRIPFLSIPTGVCIGTQQQKTFKPDKPYGLPVRYE
jgi:hypothetical protein